MARPRAAAKEEAPTGVTRESIIAELEARDNEYPDEAVNDSFVDVWAHRADSESFVRAFAWARRRGNGLKGCLVYADAHELNHEETDEPVALKD